MIPRVPTVITTTNMEVDSLTKVPTGKDMFMGCLFLATGAPF